MGGEEDVGLWVGGGWGGWGMDCRWIGGWDGGVSGQEDVRRRVKGVHK